MARKPPAETEPAAPDPLTVGREAARGLNRVTKIAEEEYRRQQQAPPAAGPGDEDLADELDALASHLAQLEAGAGEIRMDIYLTHPLPPGFKERLYLDRIEGFRVLDDLNDEIARRIQARGRWGPMQIFLHSKLRGADGRWQFIPGGSRTVAIDIAKTAEAVNAAAATTTAPALDPILAAKTMLEAGKALTPAAPEKSQAEMLGPLITSVAGAFEKLASAQSGPTSEVWKTVAPLVPPLLTKLLAPPKDDFLEKLVLMRESGLLRSGQGGGGLQDLVAAMRFAFEMAPAGGGGDRTWADRFFDFLDRHAESGLARGKELIELARTRAAGRPAAPLAPPLPPGAPTPSTPPPALVEFQHELAVAAGRHDTGFFPTLRERIVALFPQGGPELVDAVSVDPAADQVGLARLGQAGLQLTPPIQTYLRTFCNWLRYVRRQQQTPPPGAPSANGAKPINARCATCGTTYQLDDETQWQEDTKRCDAGECKGELVRV